MKRVYPVVMYLEGNPNFKVIFIAPTTGIVVEVEEQYQGIYHVGQVKTTFNNIEEPNSNFSEALGGVGWYANLLKKQREDFKQSVKAIDSLLGD